MMTALWMLLLASCGSSLLAGGAAITLRIVVDPAHHAVSARSADSPFVVPDLGSAQAAIRAALSAHNGDVDVDVALAAGVHRVPPGGFVLTAADTPALGRRVAWRGPALGAAMLSGGDNVTGWAPSTDPSLPAGVFTAPVPAALRGSTSRQLYVNGRRAARTSRSAASVLPGLALDTTDCPACSYAVACAEPRAWSNPSDVEFVYTAVADGWSEARCGVAAVTAGSSVQPNCSLSASDQPDCGFAGSNAAQCAANVTADHPLGCCWHPGGAPPSTHWCIAPVFPGNVTATRIVMRQPCLWNLVNRMYQPVGGSPPVSVENVREHLTERGTWYFDRAGEAVLYFPLAGEDMRAAATVIATEESLLALNGAARQEFAGLTFAFATWLRPGQDLGYVEAQSTACSVCPYGVTSEAGCGKYDVFEMTPGNVALTGARAIDFANCTFTHLGAYAASARGGSQNISWRGCVFADISAGALALGDTASFNITDPAAWDANLTVADCTAARGIGVEFTGATTLFAAYVADTTVEHCLLANASYSAITLGWGWGREASRRGGNRLIANRVEGAQTARCCDGGGIYTLGPQPGSAITNNYILQGPPAPHAGNAIYNDNGSGGFHTSGNVIDGIWGAYLFQDDSLGPYGPGAICPGRDGSPADCGMVFSGNTMRTAAGGTTQHVNSTYVNNTLLAPGAALPPAAAAVVAAAGPRD